MTGEGVEKRFLDSVDKILAALNILKIVTNAQDYENWLKVYHNKKVDSKLVEGYRFFVTTVVGFLIHAIEENISLELQEDSIFSRAKFKGVPIEDVPNTCEKTIFIKNVWNLSRSIRRAKNWESVKESVKHLKPLIKVFEQIYDNASPTIDIPKDLALNVVTKYQFSQNFMREGNPFQFTSPSTIGISISPVYFMRILEGYFLSAQYLWFKLLDKDKSLLDEFHEVSRKILGELEKVSNRDLKEDWCIFDEFVRKIDEKVIEPLKDKFGLDLILEQLLIVKGFDKNDIKPLLSKEDLQDPEYFQKKSTKDIEKWLDYKLLWYNVQILTGSIFSGVPAFVRVLAGSVVVDEDKVFVKIFKHPVGEGKYDYSYGILIPALSSIADYSGWLIFFDCATDYSGFGGSLYVQAKCYIDGFKDRIIVEEIEVEKEIFREYLKEKSMSSVFDRIVTRSPLGEITAIDISKIKREMEEFRENVKGLLFELLVYKWIQKQRYFDEVEHNYEVNEEKIDVFSKKGNRISLFECKITVHKDEINRILGQINRKKEVLEGKYPDHFITPILVTYSVLPAERKKFFEERGIIVKDGFNKEIRKSYLLPKDQRKLIKQIFELNT